MKEDGISQGQEESPDVHLSEGAAGAASGDGKQTRGEVRKEARTFASPNTPVPSARRDLGALAASGTRGVLVLEHALHLWDLPGNLKRCRNKKLIKKNLQKLK